MTARHRQRRGADAPLPIWVRYALAPQLADARFSPTPTRGSSCAATSSHTSMLVDIYDHLLSIRRLLPNVCDAVNLLPAGGVTEEQNIPDRPNGTRAHRRMLSCRHTAWRRNCSSGKKGLLKPTRHLLRTWRILHWGPRNGCSKPSGPRMPTRAWVAPQHPYRGQEREVMFGRSAATA